MASDETLERLDLIISLLKIAFADEINMVRVELRDDKVANALLERCSDGWIASGPLQAHVEATAKVTTRTARNRIADLVAIGALAQRGDGRSRAYRATGLV